MQAVVVAELGVEGDRQQGALTGGDGLAVDGGEDLDVGTVLGDPRGADEDRAHRAAVHVGELEVLLEGVKLAPEGVALGHDVHQPEVLAVEQDQPGAGAEDRLAGGVEGAQRVRDVDAALERIEDLPFALTGGLFCRNPHTVEHVVRRTPVGNIYVNRPITGAMVGRQPFGGNRLSGTGTKAGGPDYLLQFVEPRVVTENTMRQGIPVE